MRTGTVTYRLDDLKKAIIPLGLVGENEFTHVFIDAGDLFAKYPAALVSMSVQPPKGTKYPVVVTRDGNVIEWVVKASDLVHKGQGEFQLTFTENNVVIRSYVGKTNIDRSLPGSEGTAPDPITDFVEAAGETLAEVQEALTAIPEAIADALEAAKESGEFDGADGVGISSIVKTGSSGLTDTYTITLTNNNTYTFTVTNGENGEDGDDGDDGVGIQSIAKTGTSGLTDTYTITLTNNNTYTFTVTNGKDGDPTELIDDTSTEATNKVWSAKKTNDELSPVKSALLELDQDVSDVKTAIQGITPNAQQSDIGKALILKTIDQTGKPTAFEYGEAGGGSVDPSVIEQKVDEWLEENITNPDSPPLDRSLSSGSAAAPADLVGAMANLEATRVTGLLSPFVQGKISSGVIDPTATTHCYIGKLSAKKDDTLAYSRYNSKINSSNILVLYSADGTTWIQNVTLTNGSTHTFSNDCQFCVMAGVNTGATLQEAIDSASQSFTATLSEASDLVEAVKGIDNKIATAKEQTLATVSPQLIGITNYAEMTSVAKAVIKSIKLIDPDPTKTYCLVVAKASSGGEAKFEVYRMTAQMGFDAKVCEYGSATFDGRTFVRLEQYNSSGIRAEIALDFSVETSINITGVKYVISPAAYTIGTVVEVQNILIPSNLYVANGHTIQLFPKNLLLDRSKDCSEFVSKWDGYTSSTKLGEEVINIPYSASGADMAVSLQFKDHLTGQYSTFGTKTVHVNPVSVATPYSIKMLVIGDSFMDYPWYSSESTIHTGRGVMAFIKDYADDDGNTIEYIGTHLSYTDNGENYYSESYGGWQEDFYVDTSKHAYEGSQIYSPFCINGTACDFASYFTNLGEVPDIVVFFLGMNGDASATNGQAIQTMITGIKAVNASTKFIVCTIPPYFKNRYLYNYAYFNGDAQKYKKNSAYLNLFDGQESNGIYMVPINAMYSAEYHYITADEAILNFNTDVKMPICRNHHPNKTGVQMIADAIYSVIQAIMAS